MIRYKDPTFDSKRLWVSRLLAQFISDNALIISIDESHLRHDSQKRYQWQFYRRDSQLRKVLAAQDDLERVENLSSIHEIENEKDSKWSAISSSLSELSSKVKGLQGRKPKNKISSDKNRQDDSSLEKHSSRSSSTHNFIKHAGELP
jgi:hypothetical protein